MLRQAPLRATGGRVSGWADEAGRVRRAAQPPPRVLAADGSRAGLIATTHMQRALVHLALLMRVVPLLQVVATMSLGFSADRRPWLNVAAGCLALGWSSSSR
jgi:hypothetical protein